MEEDTKSKVFFVTVMLCFVFAIAYSTHSNNNNSNNNASPAISQVSENRYGYGILKNNATWTDEFDDVYHMSALKDTFRVHRNDKPVRVEIWNLDIVMSDGKTNRNIVMIYFLEGKYSGRWGYTLRAYTGD